MLLHVSAGHSARGRFLELAEIAGEGLIEGLADALAAPAQVGAGLAAEAQEGVGDGAGLEDRARDLVLRRRPRGQGAVLLADRLLSTRVRRALDNAVALASRRWPLSPVLASASRGVSLRAFSFRAGGLDRTPIRRSTSYVSARVTSHVEVGGAKSASEKPGKTIVSGAGGLLPRELCGGTNLSGQFGFCRVERPRAGEPEAYYEAAARDLKERSSLPVMLVGGIRAFETAERLVADGVTDYVCLSRPLIREPDLVMRWRSGDASPAFCDSDNACFKPARQGEGLYCVNEARRRQRT